MASRILLEGYLVSQFTLGSHRVGAEVGSERRPWQHFCKVKDNPSSRDTARYR
jgi:hypothetical protein